MTFALLLTLVAGTILRARHAVPAFLERIPDGER